MKKTLVVMLGASLILAGAAIFAYSSLTNYLPLLGSENGQSTVVNYVAFLCIALGGADVLILLFAFSQWIIRR